MSRLIKLYESMFSRMLTLNFGSGEKVTFANNVTNQNWLIESKEAFVVQLSMSI